MARGEAFDEDILEGMDFVMDEARKRGLKIIWAVSDNWYDVGEPVRAVEPDRPREEDFFTDAKVHEPYVRTFSRDEGQHDQRGGVGTTRRSCGTRQRVAVPGCDPSVMRAWIRRRARRSRPSTRTT